MFVRYFHFIIKSLAFSIFLGPVFRFSFRIHCCKPLDKTPCTIALISDVSMSVAYKGTSNIHVMP